MRSVFWIMLACLGAVGLELPVNAKTNQPHIPLSNHAPVLLSLGLSLDRSEYLEGEAITVTAHFTFDAPGAEEINPFSAMRRLEITDSSGNKMEGGEGLWVSDLAVSGSADFITKIQLNGDFYSPETRTAENYEHLLPGSYTCRCTNHDIRSSISFRVLPVPDSLKEIWAHYVRISSVTYKYSGLGLSLRAATDTVAYRLQQVMSYPPGYPFRQRCLSRGLDMYRLASYKGRWAGDHRTLTSADSLSFLQVMKAYSKEPSRGAYYMVVNAWDILYDSMPYGPKKIKALKRFAKSFHDAEFEQAAKKLLDERAQWEGRRK